MIPEILLTSAIEGYVLGAGAVIVRLIGFLVGMPMWNHGAVPPRVRAIFAIQTALLVVVGLGFPAIHTGGGVESFLGVLAPELLLGLACGMVVRVLLSTAEGMGQMVSMTIGLGFAAFVDPGTGLDSTAVGRLIMTSAVLLFVAGDFHLPIIAAFLDTYRILPVGEAYPVLSTGQELAGLGAKFFALSLRLAAPVMATGLMIYVVLAVIARVAPQLNLFAIGFAILIPAGLFTLYVGAADTTMAFADQFGRVPQAIRALVTYGKLP